MRNLWVGGTVVGLRMAASMKRVIHWFRRDLRITDNTALNAACESGEQVIPVYVTSDWTKHHRWTGPARQKFLCGCLESLARNIETLEGKLIFRQGDQVKALLKLAEDSQAEAIFFNEDPDPFGREVEEKLRKAGRERGIEIHGFKDAVLHGPDEVLTQSGGPYRVYSPYGRSWRALDKASPGKKAGTLNTPSNIKSGECPSLKTWKLEDPQVDFVEPGERAARKRLKEAIEGPLSSYSNHRNIPAGRTTSRISQDLRFGLLSIREVYETCVNAADQTSSSTAKKSFSKFIGELAWREFYIAILKHYPEVLEQEYDPKFRNLKWEMPEKKFEAWCKGETGFPIVDAGIRELLGTGFMHNRVRMIVAMFLTKDLRVDWRLGEQFFMQHLVDGEIASNNGGWQWSAGVGADAAPYFRIQNPWTQTKDYDGKGEYIKQWVPELKDVDPKLFQASPKGGESLAKGYPEPIVDHSEERKKTLEWFSQHKER